MNKEMVVIGAGGHGRVCADIAEAAGYVMIGFADENHALGELINGLQVVANTFDDIKEHCQPGFRLFFVGISDNALREQIFNLATDLNYDLPTIIHPSAVVSRHARIGPGTVVMPNAVVNANARIGKACILSTGCSVDYDSEIGDCVHISPGVAITGNVKVGAKSFIGTGASIIPGVEIGESCLVGAGAAVTKSIAAGGRVAGVPGKPILHQG